MYFVVRIFYRLKYCFYPDRIDKQAQFDKNSIYYLAGVIELAVCTP